MRKRAHFEKSPVNKHAYGNAYANDDVRALRAKAAATVNQGSPRGMPPGKTRNNRNLSPSHGGYSFE